MFEAVESRDEIDALIWQRKPRNIAFDEAERVGKFRTISECPFGPGESIAVDIDTGNRFRQPLRRQMKGQLPRPAPEIEHVTPAQFLVIEMAPAFEERIVAPVVIVDHIRHPRVGRCHHAL